MNSEKKGATKETDEHWIHVTSLAEDDLNSTEVKKEKIVKKKDPAVGFFQLWRFSTPLERLLILLGLICSGGIGTLMPVQILIFGGLVNDIQPALENPTRAALEHAILPIIKQIVYLGAGMLAGGYLAQMLWVLTGELQTKRIRALYVHSILRQDMGWFDKAEDGSLNTRLAADTQLVQDAISEKAGSTMQMTAQFVTGFVIAFVKGWRLAIVMFACLPLMAGVGGVMMMFITKLISKGQDSYAEAGAVAEQALSGIKTVYSFSLQKRFEQRYNALLKVAEFHTTRAGITVGWGFGLFMFILFSSYGLAFWYGSQLVIKQEGGMNSGNVLTVFLCMIMGAMGLMMIPPNLSAFANGRAAAYRIFQTIDRVPTIDSASEEGLRPEKIAGHIQFKNIDFSYPSRPDLQILKDLSLDIMPGKTVAFVGPSGSGKSTSVSLVQRFYDPLAGQVLLDGVDLKDINVKYLRRQIGVVSQEPVLFNMSIKENLLMGCLGDSVTQEEITEACKKANCHNFIETLPQGYNTMVGDHGGMLSGGQKQRIAIARALLKNPKILLLDEATSALDTQSERIVQRALDAASRDRTTIVIAHRLSTIRNADLIVVMEKGILIEKGTHDQLYAQGGVYTQLVDKQTIKMHEDPATKVDKHMDDAELEEALENEKKELALAAQALAQTKIVNSVAVEAQGRDNSIDLIPLSGGDYSARPESNKVKVTIHSRAKTAAQRRREEEERKKRIADQPAPIWRVLREMGQEKWLLVFGCISAAIAGCVFPIYGYIFSKIIVQLNQPLDQIAPAPLEGSNLYAFILVMIGLAALFSLGGQVTLFEMAGARYTARLRAQTFAALLRQEVGYFDEESHGVGALASNLSIDAGGVNEMITKVWGDVIQLFVSSVVALVIAFVYAWQLALVILGCAPFIVVSAALESRVYQGFEDQTKKAYAESGETASEAFKEVRTVASLTRESYFEKRYEENIQGPHRLALRKAFVASLGYGAQQGFNMWTSAVGFYAGIQFIALKLITFEEMFVVILVLMISAGTIGRSSMFVAKFAKAKNCAINTFEIVDRVTKINAFTPGKEVKTLDGEIQFKDIAFKYPSRPDVDIFTGKFGFEVKPKQTVALVGPSGCGKSTTIGMLQRWYDPLAGTVVVDGTDALSYQLLNLRSHMSIVSQEPVLFDMTIRENILYGTDRTDITEDELDEVCKMANIYKFIKTELSNGYDTRVGDKGSQLSGGQKQRVAIARALIRSPKVLLLDEATSALDSESEKLVQEAIDRSLDGRTVITIAHRLSTIQNADLICVVKDGRVVEQGKHFELLEKNGLYKDLVNQQSLNVLQ